MDRKYIIFKCVIFCLCITAVLTDLSSDDLDEVAKDLEEKVKSLNPNSISKHPLAIEWKKQCIKKAGSSTFNKIRKSGSRMVQCFTSQIQIKTILREVNDSRENGELDTVFKKYCGKRDELMDCVEDYFSAVELCADDELKNSLNITRDLINAGIDFTCHDDGDRIAIFLAEDGIECVKEHYKEIKSCIQDIFPELQNVSESNNLIETINPDIFGINEERCDEIAAIQQCIVKAAEKCDDPTPANVLDSLLIQMRKVTPCVYSANEASPIISVHGHAPPSSHLGHVFPLVLTLFMAALTAANILI